MLIDHDFEWEEEREGRLPSAAEAPAAGLPWPISAPELLSSAEVGVGFVIRQRPRRFSRRTLALAIVALLSSVSLRPFKTYHSNTEAVIPRLFIPPGHGSLDQAGPGRRSAAGLPRESEAGREDRAGRERPQAEDRHTQPARERPGRSKLPESLRKLDLGDAVGCPRVLSLG